MPSKVSSALRSRSTASCVRRSRKQATSWRWPILAVVLGLFAHQEALAQQTLAETDGSALNTLTVTPQVISAVPGLDAVESVVTLDPMFNSAEVDRAFTGDVESRVSQVTVTATPKEPDWSVSYAPADADANEDDYQLNLVPGLTNSNRNRITVEVTDGSTTRSYTITVTRTTAPTAPRNLRATSSHQAVMLSWTAPSSNGGMHIQNYQFRMKEEDDADYGNWRDIDRSSDAEGEDDSTTSHNVVTDNTNTILANGTTYLFQVRAWNAKNGGGYESNTDEATPAGPLPAPRFHEEEEEAIKVGSRRVQLTWIHLDDGSVSGYQYQQRVVPGSPGGWSSNIADHDLVGSGDDRYRSYTVTNLTNGRTYGFRVRGTNSVGGGAASDEVEATPEAVAPSAPRSLTAAAADEQVTLSWTAPSDNGGESITRYEYLHREQSSPYPVAWISTGGTQPTVTVYGLTNGTTYDFKVRAVNRLMISGGQEVDGPGQESLEVSAKPLGKPLTEVNLAEAKSDEDSRVELIWTLTNTPPSPSDDDVSGFQYHQKAGGGYGSWIDIRNSDATTRNHFVTGLTNGTTYTFEVRAVNSSGGGLASNEESAVPSIPPGAPTNLTATAGDKEVRLTWTAPRGRWRQAHPQVRMRNEGRRRRLPASSNVGRASAAWMRRQIARRVHDVPHPH